MKRKEGDRDRGYCQGSSTVDDANLAIVGAPLHSIRPSLAITLFHGIDGPVISASAASSKLPASTNQ